jgi:hypothetical protein
MIESLGQTIRTQRGSTNTLDRVSENICIVLKRLDECNHAYWLLQKSRNQTLVRLREFCSAFRCRYRGREKTHVTDIRSKRQFAWKEASHLATKGNASETDTAVALAILQLVGAYRAMDVLSASPFPTGSPYSFGLACHCLCAALVGLDEYSTGSELRCCETSFTVETSHDL